MKNFKLIKCFSYLVLFALSFNLNASDKLTIYATNYPLKYFAERIAGNHATVMLPLPTDIDPASWSPKVETIIKFQTADLIIINGAGHEKWIHNVSIPQQKLINTSIAFKNELITEKDNSTHSHGLEGEHTHHNYAFTTWLDFTLAIKQASAIYTALIQQYPKNKSEFQSNYELLKKALSDLDQNFKIVTDKISNIVIIASHPKYQYMQRRYNLNLKNMFWNADVLPSNYEWNALNELLKSQHSNWMIWNKPPLKESKERLKEIGIQSIEINPCANVPSEGDFISVMQKNLLNLSKIFD